jgi:hypothetical protein
MGKCTMLITKTWTDGEANWTLRHLLDNNFGRPSPGASTYYTEGCIEHRMLDFHGAL